MLADFLQNKFRLTKEEDHELAINQAKQSKCINMSVDTSSLQGINFEIQKDVDRTLLGDRRFTPNMRASLATVLRTFAAVDPEVGYVQGLNIVVANFLLLFDKETIRIDPQSS
jgi:hypothetical protein